MKRGWITWDKSELPPSAFESRLATVRQELAKRDLPALVVYTDVWRSNQGRYLANFMPYWNRALLVIPREGAPVLLCGLSPRVYPWIRLVTILDDIRPNMDLSRMCGENGWTKIGALDLPLLPSDLAVPNAVDVPWSAIHPEPDEAELMMYRRAADMARKFIDDRKTAPFGLIDHELVAGLEMEYRRAGAEDLVILVSHGDKPPLPPNGSEVTAWSSIAVALEYRGHWVKVIRPFRQVLGAPLTRFELLSGAYPYEPCAESALGPGALFVGASETTVEGKRLFLGDTWRMGPDGFEAL